MFTEDLATVENWVNSYGAMRDEPVPARRLRSIALATGASLVVASIAVAVAQRQVIWPWRPTVATVPEACAALRQAWPMELTVRLAGEPHGHKRESKDAGQTATCAWAIMDGRAGSVATSLLEVRFFRPNGTFWRSTSKTAVRRFHSALATHPTARRLTDVGDDAFTEVTWGAKPTSVGVIRRANILIEIRITGDPTHNDGARLEALTSAIAVALVAVVRAA